MGDFNEVKRRIVHMLTNEIQPRKSKVRKSEKVLYVVLALAILCTTLPSPSINIAACMAAAVAGTAWLVTARRKFRPLLMTLTAVSLLSGCAGPLLMKTVDSEMVTFGPASASIRSSTVRGVGVLGFGLGQVNPGTAIEQAKLEKVIAIDRARGYGLISVAWVTVYGEGEGS
jgi:hypothetical protein